MQFKTWHRLLNALPFRVSLSVRLASKVFLASVVISLVVTGIELLETLRNDRVDVERKLDLMLKPLIPELGQAIWDINTSSLELLAIGLSRQPDITHVKVVEPRKTLVEIGSAAEGALIFKYPLFYATASGQQREVGHLVIAVDFQAIRNRSLGGALWILGSNFLVFAGVSALLMLLIATCATRPALSKTCRVKISGNP